MLTKRKFKSIAFEAIHSSATALFKVGAIDKTTMKSFDDSCIVAHESFVERKSSFKTDS